MAQTATILVTDLVDSTATRVRLGEERAEDVRRAHDALLAEQAATHGGNVIKGMGDGLLVAFAGAAEALTAAVAMQQALHSYSRREGIALAMRVGLSIGDVTFEDGDCFGTPVIEAARLCAVAEPGGILAAQVVQVLARGRATVEVVTRGVRELKGLPEPIEVCDVRWDPLPAGAALRGATPYVGREREQETLRQIWETASKGSGGLMLIAGEPGIGKTRLVEELVAQIVRPAGGVVLFGGCHDGDVVANAPFVEAITDWARRTPPELAAAMLGHEAPVVARMVPAITEVLPDVGDPLPVSPDAETARLHDAVGQVVLRLAGSAPVVLVVDDLHWADGATVEMLRAVSRAARRGALLVIGTYRETDIDRRHPFAQALAALQREVEPTRLVLSGLDIADVHAMLERIAEHEVPEDFATTLAAETEGNPFFLRETLLHLWEEGELRFEAGAWTLARQDVADLGIPAGIRDVIGRRLSRLPDATNRLLSAAALFEVAFPLLVAAEVAGLEEDDALDAIDAALEARVVHATDDFDQYAFTHALFRHALVEELNPSRQVRMHRAIATALEKQLRGAPTPALSAALARHYHRSAALPNAEQGVPYALAVADDAARRYARREEFDALTVALELLPEGDERWYELTRRKAESAVFANLGADRVLEPAKAAGELIASVEGEDAACDFVAGLAADCSLLDDLRLAWNVGAVARRWLRPDRRDQTYVVLRAFELSQREFEDPEHPGMPLDTPERRELHDVVVDLQLAQTILMPQFGESFNDIVYTLGSRAEAQRAYEAAVAGSGDRGYPLWFLGEYRELRDWLRDYVDDALARGLIAGAVFNLALLTRVHNVLGEYEEADAALNQGFQLLPRISPTSNAVFQLLVAAMLQRIVRGGRIASNELDNYALYGDSPDVRWAWMGINLARGWSYAHEGNSDDAVAVLHAALPILERAASWSPNYPIFLLTVTQILWELQRTDEVAIIERNLRAKVEEPDVRYLESDARLTLALLCALDGRPEEARDWFDKARRVLAEQGSEALLIWVDWYEGEMNVRLGSEENLARARALLERARSRCVHPALAPWVERIDELLNV